MAVRLWNNLSPDYRARLERGGVTREVYESGAVLKAARGHAATPERPARAFNRPDLYGEYLRRRVAKGKPVPPNILPAPRGKGSLSISDRIGWPNREALNTVLITRSRDVNQPGTITVIERTPEGEVTATRVFPYDQHDFVTVSRMAKQRGYVVVVESTPVLGVTA